MTICDTRRGSSKAGVVPGGGRQAACCEEVPKREMLANLAAERDPDGNLFARCMLGNECYLTTTCILLVPRWLGSSFVASLILQAIIDREGIHMITNLIPPGGWILEGHPSAFPLMRPSLPFSVLFLFVRKRWCGGISLITAHNVFNKGGFEFRLVSLTPVVLTN